MLCHIWLYCIRTHIRTVLYHVCAYLYCIWLYGRSACTVLNGLTGYNSLMFLLAIPIIPRTKTATTTTNMCMSTIDKCTVHSNDLEERCVYCFHILSWIIERVQGLDLRQGSSIHMQECLRGAVGGSWYLDTYSCQLSRYGDEHKYLRTSTKHIHYRQTCIIFDALNPSILCRLESLLSLFTEPPGN